MRRRLPTSERGGGGRRERERERERGGGGGGGGGFRYLLSPAHLSPLSVHSHSRPLHVQIIAARPSVPVLPAAVAAAAATEPEPASTAQWPTSSVVTLQLGAAGAEGLQPVPGMDGVSRTGGLEPEEAGRRSLAAARDGGAAGGVQGAVEVSMAADVVVL
jgi:hypothetical protein